MPNPQSLIPHPSSLIPASRGGFTLIEMLIVIGIMMILVTMAATIMPSATESRRTREAARLVNIYLGSARIRPMETGRPCGVTFHNFPPAGSGSPAFAMSADQCEVPPPYAGDAINSTASVISLGAGLVSGTVSMTFSDGNLADKLVRPGDLIQLNGQGPFYTVTSNSLDSDGYLTNVGGTAATSQPLTATFDSSLGQIVPWSTATASTVPFRILRSPVKSGAAPLQLPTGAVVDLQYCGAGSGCLASTVWDALTTYSQGQTVQYNNNGVIYVSTQAGNIGHTPPTSAPYTDAYWQPLTSVSILFSSTGAVDNVYLNAIQSPVTDPIYLLIGKRGRVSNPFVAGNGNESTLTNWQDLNNIWVTINPQTGLVNTDSVAAGADVATARSLAAQGIGMGGK